MPTYVAKIPNPPPLPYNTYMPSWQDWVLRVNGKTLLLGDKKSFGDRKGRVVHGPQIPLLKGAAISWLPWEWIRERTTAQASQPTTCDCPSRKLFIQGCPGH